MKRKVIAGLWMLMGLGLLSGCGSDYKSYVKLADYKGIEAQKVIFQVSEEELQERIEEDLYEYAEYEEINDRSVRKGDYVNITYTGTIDGEEIENYCGQEEEYQIGGDEFYKEAEDALIGLKPGEKADVEFVLSKEKAFEEGDAGKKVKMQINLNAIYKENLPVYDEEYIKDYTEYDSMDAYEMALKEEIYASKEEEYQSYTSASVLEKIVEASTFKGYPQDLYDKCAEEYDSENAYYADMYGMELDEFLETFGIDEETREQSIVDSVNQEMVVDMIAKKEKISASDEEVNEFAENSYQDYDYETVDAFLQDFSSEEIKAAIIYDKVSDFLYKNAKLVEISEEEYLKQEE